MRKNPRRILSPQRLPFRHPGAGFTNLTNTSAYCNMAAGSMVRGAGFLQQLAKATAPYISMVPGIGAKRSAMFLLAPMPETN